MLEIFDVSPGEKDCHEKLISEIHLMKMQMKGLIKEVKKLSFELGVMISKERGLLRELSAQKEYQ